MDTKIKSNVIQNDDLELSKKITEFTFSELHLLSPSSELTALQRAKKKYNKKYVQLPETKELFKKNSKKYYHQNKEEIEERRKKRLEDPEFQLKYKEQIREASRKYREKKKLEVLKENI